MLLDQFVFLVFYTVQMNSVWSWTIPDLSGFTQPALIRKAEDFDNEYESKGYTLEEAAKIRILTEKPTTDIERAARICSVLVSSNFTSVERAQPQSRSFDFLILFQSLSFNKNEEAQLYKNVLCSYISHPTEDIKHAEALGLSMIPFFKFEHIRKRNNNNQSVVAARQLCEAFYSVNNLANLDLNSNPTELSDNQLEEFKNLWNQVEHLDWDKSPILVVQSLCDLLNEKILPEEQAKALKITVDVYSSILNGLKELSKDNSIQNRGDIYRQICRDINLSFGYSEFYVSQNGSLTSDEEIKRFSRYTLRVESDENKWKSIKNVCVYLNETVSIKYIAESSGLSDDQLAQHNSYMPKDDEFLMDNLKSQLLQTINLCNVVKSDKVRQDDVCRCPPGFEGNALDQCKPVKIYVSPPQLSPCRPSPCGPNSQCRESNGHAVCDCIPDYIGSPPTCRSQCTVNSDCSLTEFCYNEKCRNACIGACGIEAVCVVVNQSPICSCPNQYTGNPLDICKPIIEQTVQEQIDPCQPSPCGPNSECRAINDIPFCSCIKGFIGTPPNCLPECNSNAECATNLVCIDYKCKDLCPNWCGQNAECRVESHTPHCTCLAGYVGNPLTQCMIQQPHEESACIPNPCGINAICSEVNGAGSCQCLPETFGDPYVGCRPECVLNSDCAANKACIRNKCQQPCDDDICARNAVCKVVNHVPSCACRAGYNGDPYRFCIKDEPCSPSPCGPNSNCKEVNGEAVCSCVPNDSLPYTPIFYYAAGMEAKMEEFVFKASTIFSSPLNDRLELLREACVTTFPRLYTIES